MRSSVFYAALGLLFFTVPAWGQLAPPMLEKGKGEELAPPVQPFIYRATAAEVDGKVVIRLSWPSLQTTGKGAQKDLVYVWEKRKEPQTLGKDVKAYSQAGKPLSKEAVLKALAKPVAVVCFVRANADDPERPDPFYTAMFRDDAVLLVFRGE